MICLSCSIYLLKMFRAGHNLIGIANNDVAVVICVDATP